MNRQNRPKLLPLACALTTAFAAGRSQGQQMVLPTHPVVAAGHATVNSPAPGQLVVNQQTDRAVVNWGSFSLGAGTQVNFVQPGSGSAILNRVSGSTPSSIAGQVSGNGQVFLVNPNGIEITPTGTVRAAGFTLSTLDIADADFLAGRLSFSGGGSSAGVKNAGMLSASPGGFAALLGGQAVNEGRIDAPLGRIGVGAGERATLNLLGSSFLQVAVPGTPAPGARPLVEMGGVASADGGRIEISAATASQVLRQAVNIPGELVAREAMGRSGDIVLSAGSGGDATVTGRIDVSSATGTGGHVAVTGKDVILQGATIDASGARGGGSIELGGGARGGGPLPHASQLQLDAGSRVNADARADGSGGRIVLWSDERTQFEGRMSARGAGAGHGGTAEVSSHGVLGYAGFVDLRAQHGATGSLLLDPFDVTISTGADSNHDASFTATGNSSVVNTTTLAAALAGANVTVSTGAAGAQSGDITVANAVSWGSGNTLTLDAARDIKVNAPITGNGGLQLTAGRNIGINSNITGSGGALNVGLTASPTGGEISINAATINTAGGNLTATAGQAAGGNALLLVDATLDVGGGTGNVTVSSGSDTTFASGALQLLASGSGSITLDSASSGAAGSGIFFNTNTSLTSTGTVNVNGTAAGGTGLYWFGSASLTSNSGALSLAGQSTGGNGVWFNDGGAVTLTANGALSITGTSVDFRGIGLGNNVSLSTTGDASLTGTSTNERGLWFNSTNSVSATNGTLTLSGSSANSEGTFINFGANTFSHSGSGSIALSGSSSAGSGLLINPAVSVGVTGDVTFAGSSTNWTGVQLSAGDTLSASNGSFSMSGSSTNSNGLAFAAGAYTLTQSGSGALSLGGSSASSSGAGTSLSNGTSIITSGNVSLNGVDTIGGTGISLAGNNSVSVTGGSLQLSGTSSSGPGVWLYGGSNSLSAAAGTLTVSGASTSGAGLGVSSAAQLSQTAGDLLLAGSSTGPTSLQFDAGSAVSNTGSGTLHLDAATGMSLGGSLSSTTGPVWLSAGGAVTQPAGSISTPALQLTGTGSYALDAAGNQLQTIAADTGSLLLHSTTDIASGTVLATTGVTTSGPLTLLSDGALTLGAGAPASGASPVLSAGTMFVNNAGASGLTASSGRWLVYAADPATSSFGSLDSANTALWNATYALLPPASVTASGNRYLFALQPTLTFSPLNTTKVYGDDATSAVQSSFSVAGYHAGVFGAFLADTAATAYAGAPLLSSPGALATAAVAGSPYALSVAAGSLTSPAGYTLAFAASPAQLAVTPRLITISANDLTRTYGDPNPALTYALSSGSLANGDTLAGSLQTSAGTASPVGTYAITQGTLDAGMNYALTYVPGTLTATPRPITVSANDLTRTYGDPNPALTYALSSGSLVNGDTLAGSLQTSAGTASPVGTYAIAQGTLAASPNYALTYVQGALTVAPRATFVDGRIGDDLDAVPPAPPGSEASDGPGPDTQALQSESVSPADPQRYIVVAFDDIPASPASAGAAGPSRRLGRKQPGTAAQAMAVLEREQRIIRVATWPVPAMRLLCVLYRLPDGVAQEHLLSSLSQQRYVRVAEPLKDFAPLTDQQPPQYNDPYAPLQRGFKEIDAAGAQRFSVGLNVPVAVIDTAVDAGHPDLRGHVAASSDMVDVRPNTAKAQARHGTEVAGIISAAENNREGIVGIAPGARISAYRACWYAAGSAGARCNSFTLAKALASVMDTDARIVNLSLGGPPDALLALLTRKLVAQGRIVVAALPPSGRAEGFPSSVPGVLVVGSSDKGDLPRGLLAAPGRDILTLTPGGSYDFDTGSSLATAHVSGTAALLLALDPSLTAADVQSLLASSQGATGAINAAQAVAALVRKQALAVSQPAR